MGNFSGVLKRFNSFLFMFWVLMIFSSSVYAAVTVTSTSSPQTGDPESLKIFHVDIKSDNLSGQYTSYKVAADSDYTDIWVKITNFASPTTLRVWLADNETDLIHLGALTSGTDKTAFFYLNAHNIASNQSYTDVQTHDIEVYNGKPGTAGSTLIQSTAFQYDEVTHALAASANKVRTVVATPDDPNLGALVVITVYGETGINGDFHRMFYSPATYPEWLADTYELYTTSITFYEKDTSNVIEGPYMDQLLLFRTESVDRDYKAIYTFRAIGTTAEPTSVSPVGNFQSGNQIKHTTTSDFGDPTVIQPIPATLNYTTLSKSVSPDMLTDGGTVTYTLTFTNTGTTAVVLDEIKDVLPTSPDTTTYIAGSSSWNSVAYDDPIISGANLNWIGQFSVSAGGSSTLTYQVTIPDTDGTYTNSAIGLIGNTQIDADTGSRYTDCRSKQFRCRYAKCRCIRELL